MINADVEGSGVFALGLDCGPLGEGSTGGVLLGEGLSIEDPLTPAIALLDFFFLVIIVVVAISLYYFQSSYIKNFRRLACSPSAAR